jgi:hypothetical protein
MYRSGVLRNQTRWKWTPPHMDSSMAETVTSSSITTTMEDAKGTSSTCGKRDTKVKVQLNSRETIRRDTLLTRMSLRQGSDSSQDEIGASAILGAQLDDELGGGPVQVMNVCL